MIAGFAQPAAVSFGLRIQALWRDIMPIDSSLVGGTCSHSQTTISDQHTVRVRCIQRQTPVLTCLQASTDSGHEQVEESIVT